MGIFDPQATQAVQPMAAPQAVAPAPSAIGAVGSLLGTALKGIGEAQQYRATNGPTEASITRAEDQARLVGFQNGLNEVAQLRAQGMNTEADARQRQLMVNAARDGLDLSSGDVKAVYEATTGQSANFMTLSPEQAMISAEMETPEFRAAYMGTFAYMPEDATDEQRMQAAFESSAMAGANQTAVLSGSFNFEHGGREAITSLINTHNTNIMGTLNVVAAEGGIVPIAMIDSAEAQWNVLRQGILARRGNVSSDKWASVEAQIAGVDAQFTTIRNISGAAGENGVNARLAQGVQAYVMDLVERDELTTLQGNAFLKMMEDPNVVQGMNILSTEEISRYGRAAEVPEAFRATGITQLGDPVTDPREVDDPGNPDNLFDQSILDSLEDVDGLDLVSQAKTLSGGTIPMIRGRMAEPDKRDAAVSMLTKGFTAMYLSAGEGYTSRQGLDEVFNGDVMAIIGEIGVHDPQMAETLAEQAYYALDAQRAAQAQVLLNAGQQMQYMSYNEENNQWEADWQSVGRIPGIDIGEVQGIADEYYGGDLAAMVQDNALRYVDAEGEAVSTSLQIMFDLLSDDLFNMREFDHMVSTVRSTEIKLGAFQTMAGEYAPEDPNAPAPGEVQVTNLPGSPIRPESMTGQLIDKFEAGSGGYDTLFGQAQDSEFAGMRVSQMTIGEVLDFQSARGEGSYGEFVKSTNPEGVLATPAGRYQFVGTTLRGLVEKYNIDPNTRFSPELQDALFMAHALDTIGPLQTASAKRAALRTQWAGLKNATNGELDAMIAEIEGGGTDAATIISNGIASTTPTDRTDFSGINSLVQSAMGANAAAEGPNVTLPSAIQAVAQNGPGALAQPVDAGGNPRPGDDVNNSQTVDSLALAEAARSAENTSEAAAQTDEVALRKLRDIPIGEMTADIRAQVRAAGGDGNTPVFKDVNEALDAIYAGQIGIGDVVVIGDRVQEISAE